LDATIFLRGFGAFFWFLVIRPAAAHAEVDLLKQALSLAYLGLDLRLSSRSGLTGPHRCRNVGGRRIPLLLAERNLQHVSRDILWSLAKVRGYYLPAVSGRAVPDLLPPVAAAGAHRCVQLVVRRVQCRTPQTLWRLRSYAAMLAAFWYWCTRPGDIRRATTRDDHYVFALTCCSLVRQGVVLRGMHCCASAARLGMVEERYRR